MQLNFANITVTEIAEIYRDSYSLGQGSITIKSLFTKLIESNFFIKTMILPSSLPLAKLDADGKLSSVP